MHVLFILEFFTAAHQTGCFAHHVLGSCAANSCAPLHTKQTLLVTGAGLSPSSVHCSNCIRCQSDQTRFHLDLLYVKTFIFPRFLNHRE